MAMEYIGAAGLESSDITMADGPFDDYGLPDGNAKSGTGVDWVTV